MSNFRAFLVGDAVVLCHTHGRTSIKDIVHYYLKLSGRSTVLILAVKLFKYNPKSNFSSLDFHTQS